MPVENTGYCLWTAAGKLGSDGYLNGVEATVALVWYAGPDATHLGTWSSFDETA